MLERSRAIAVLSSGNERGTRKCIVTCLSEEMRSRYLRVLSLSLSRERETRGASQKYRSITETLKLLKYIQARM